MEEAGQAAAAGSVTALVDARVAETATWAPRTVGDSLEDPDTSQPGLEKEDMQKGPRMEQRKDVD